MTTDTEWQATNRRIFTAHPELAGGWKPGQVCDCRGLKHTFLDDDSYGFNIVEHEIPAPDLREDSTFVRVWTESKPTEFGYGRASEQWYARFPHHAVELGDTPHEALARALDAMEVGK